MLPQHPVSKQLEIQSYIIENKIDILHLQECYITDDTFTQCGYITSNFNLVVNNTPNNTFYGTASIIRNDLDIKNIHTYDQGRAIIFDAMECTWANLYLPSGNAARALREQYSSEIIPRLMIRKLARGAAGGDLNCIISPQDCTSDPRNKMSPSLRSLVNAFSMVDSYRAIAPKTRQFSRYYSTANQVIEASRIDRSYHWGDITVDFAEYKSVSSSDHLSLFVSYSLPSQTGRYITPPLETPIQNPTSGSQR